MNSKKMSILPVSESYQLDSSEIEYRKKKRFILPGLSRLSPGVIDAQKKLFYPFQPKVSLKERKVNNHKKCYIVLHYSVSRSSLEGIIFFQSSCLRTFSSLISFDFYVIS